MDNTEHGSSNIKKSDELKPKKKIKWVPLLAVFISLLALASTIWSDAVNTRRQREIQAYTYWQSFLSLAVSNPKLANGLDSIDGKSIFYIADNMTNQQRRRDPVLYEQYVKYTWFVALALGSAEIVYNLQNDDVKWRNALKQALSGHKILLTKIYDIDNNYDPKFCKLIREAVCNSGAGH